MCGPPFALSCSTHSTAQCSQVGGEKMSGELLLLLLLFSMRRHDLYVTSDGDARMRTRDQTIDEMTIWKGPLRDEKLALLLSERKKGKEGVIVACKLVGCLPETSTRSREIILRTGTHTYGTRESTYKALPSVRRLLLSSLTSSPWDFNELLYCALAPIQNSDERWTLNFC